jgi:hypothetical protein
MIKMSDIFGKIRSGAENLAKGADKLAHVERMQLEIRSIKKQVEDNYQKLGEMTYKSIASKEPENPETQGIIAKIADLNKQINAKEEEIKALNQGAGGQPAPQTQTDTQKPPTTGKNFCTACGKENDSGVKFCSECGSKMVV